MNAEVSELKPICSRCGVFTDFPCVVWEDCPNYQENVHVPEADAVNLPKHYARFKVEPITFICENKLDWFQGNIVKYVLRHDAKNGKEDLRKAKRYLEMYIKYLDRDPDWWKS